MPDDDRFSRYIGPAWRKVLRSLQGRDAPERLGDVVTQALAATVRAVHGVPSLPDLAERMQEAAVRGQPLERRPAPDVRHVPTEIAEQIAAGLATSMQRELALVSPGQAAGLLAHRLLAGFAYHYGFDRMVQILVKDTYTIRDLRAVMTDVLSGEQVSKLAGRFAARPTGDGLRAPARRARSRLMPELLTTDLEGL